ncbi:uncharacterized protein LOC118736425 [Rhagoletis pomonella]|uniref:uncharacterized protein LOC118736425 n=1 Tax=Rhagoletis pomonella TaxID=28610 RepID=UPI0017803B58|nr:uncharacterized protein LOC118736425 [Rhagoletis pomonella]
MDTNRDNQQKEEPQDGEKDDDEDAQAENKHQTERTNACPSPTDSLDRASESEKDTDTEDDEGSLHVVSSVRELKPPLAVVILKGTHTTSTPTETLASMTSTARMQKYVNFEEIVEELDIHTPSTSQVVDNVREYVKQIESRLEDEETTVCNSPRHATSPQPSAVQIVELPRETLTLATIKGASQPSFTDKPSEESEIERTANNEVERIVAENLTPTAMRERPDFHQVERENQEIAERFKQIMEMFDSFTKNLESLEMPAIKTAEKKEAEKSALPLRRRLSFKGLHSVELAAAEHAGGVSSSNVYNEFCLEVHGDRKDNAALAAAKETTTKQSLAHKFYHPSSAGSSAQPRKTEAALDPMCRDIATTVSGLELLSEEPQPWSHTTKPRALKLGAQDTQSFTTIGCQTSADYLQAQATSSASTSFCNLPSLAKDYSPTDDGIVNALIIDSITEASTSSNAAADTRLFTDVTGDSDVTVIKAQRKIIATSDQLALVKIREPPTIVNLPDDTNAPRVTSVVSDATPIDAPCERTYHTIHIEANSTPSSSELRRAPLCSRLWNVFTDFCAAVCLCLQVNKDCLFCLGFFIAFVVSASFLTAFFYRTLSINPHLVQVPVAPPHIAGHVNALQNMQYDHPL